MAAAPPGSVWQLDVDPQLDQEEQEVSLLLLLTSGCSCGERH